MHISTVLKKEIKEMPYIPTVFAELNIYMDGETLRVCSDAADDVMIYIDENGRLVMEYPGEPWGDPIVGCLAELATQLP